MGKRGRRGRKTGPKGEKLKSVEEENNKETTEEKTSYPTDAITEDMAHRTEVIAPPLEVEPRFQPAPPLEVKPPSAEEHVSSANVLRPAEFENLYIDQIGRDFGHEGARPKRQQEIIVFRETNGFINTQAAFHVSQEAFVLLGGEVEPVASGSRGPVAGGSRGPVASGSRGPVASGSRGPVGPVIGRRLRSAIEKYRRSALTEGYLRYRTANPRCLEIIANYNSIIDDMYTFLVFEDTDHEMEEYIQSLRDGNIMGRNIDLNPEQMQQHRNAVSRGIYLTYSSLRLFATSIVDLMIQSSMIMDELESIYSPDNEPTPNYLTRKAQKLWHQLEVELHGIREIQNAYRNAREEYMLGRRTLNEFYTRELN